MLRSFVVEILHSKNKQCVPLSVFVQLHQQRTASNYQFSFFFGETVFCVHLCSRKVINQVE